MKKTELNKLKLNYYENGWVLFRKIFSKKEVIEINYKIDNFLKKNYKKYSGKTINFADKNKKSQSPININSFHQLSDSQYIVKKSKNKKIRAITKHLLNSKEKFIASELFAKPAQRGLPSPIHQDNFYWCVKGGNALTVWVALDDVSSINGGIKYYDKSQKLGVVNHEPSFAKGSSQKVSNLRKYNNFKKICPKLKAGDALFHHCEIMHGSSANKSGKRRRGLTFQFRDYYASYDMKLKKQYLKSLNKQVQLRSK